MRVNRRQQHPSVHVESDGEFSTDSEDDKDEKDREDKKLWTTIRFYCLLALVVLLGLCYLHERDQRAQLILEYNSMVEKASAQLYTVQQKSKTTSLGGGIINCPECPECADNNIESSILHAETDIAVKQWKARDEALLSEIARLSSDILKLKFGSPPHYVELVIEVSPEKKSEGGKMLIELAPPELMAYSTLFFLSQVKAGAWNSCSFFLNLGVIYKEDARGGGPLCNKDAFRTIDGVGETLAFQEYSASYPHEVNTVGLSGRPGGWGFYINVSNNTKPLRPRPLDDHVSGSPSPAGDPCIGKVVRGLDTLIRLKRIEVTNPDTGETERLFQDIGEFEKFVTITSVSVVSKENLPPPPDERLK